VLELSEGVGMRVSEHGRAQAPGSMASASLLSTGPGIAVEELPDGETTLPSWLRDEGAERFRAEGLQTLVSLEHLPRGLEELVVQSCPELLRAISDSLEGSTESLRVLAIRQCPKFDGAGLLDSDWLGRLTSLRQLTVTHCGMSTPLSAELAQLSSLERLDLSHNALTHVCCRPSRGALCRLTWLDLSHNRLDSIPSTLFQQCSSLEWVDLSHNDLPSFPDGLESSQSSLLVLNLSNNHIGVLTDTLAQLTRLEVLDLSHNDGLREIPSLIAHCTSLRSLRAEHCTIELVASELCSLTRLRSLSLAGCPLYEHREDIYGRDVLEEKLKEAKASLPSVDFADPRGIQAATWSKSSVRMT
jgi:Leucine-rich repeat (LRR) protein